MSDRQDRATPFVEFIDDYFVECDEHLAIARSSLLTLEPSVERGQFERAPLDELFRSFHSMKGLSAMVGFEQAELLAHHMESYLSAVQKEAVRFTTPGLELLIAGVNALEQVISARRADAPFPDVNSLLASFASLVPTANAPDVSSVAAASRRLESDAFELSPEKSRLLTTARATGAQAWRITFMPAPALAERGVNVNTVRERLQAVGNVIHAYPQVHGGQISFAFLVAGNIANDVITSWQADGLTCVPYEEPTSTPSPNDRVAPLSHSTLMSANVVRVELSRLDDLMRMVGDLVISRARLDDTLKRLGDKVPSAERRSLQETNQAIERQLRHLREGVMRVRLVQVREVFARMQFVIRDLTREHGKKITLVLNGQETEIDKFVVERMMDPLLHLVRNAVSHGLEEAEERVAAGKTAEGKITLSASAAGDIIAIEVEDDGRGIDALKVIERGKAAGLIDKAAPATPTALIDVLCSPGFSTRDEADRASGRGVGMAVVRNAVEELGGSLTLETWPGKGTRFKIQLPLTLAIADALIVSVGGQTFAVPQVSVREIIQVEFTALKALENNELLPYRGQALPVVRLAPYFGLAGTSNQAAYALVMGQGQGLVAILVDRLFGLREIVVRSLNDPLLRVPGIAAATELGDGRLVLILDPLALARAARKQSRSRPMQSPTPKAPTSELSTVIATSP